MSATKAALLLFIRDANVSDVGRADGHSGAASSDAEPDFGQPRGPGIRSGCPVAAPATRSGTVGSYR